MDKRTLIVSQYTNLLPCYKSYFESLGLTDVHVTDIKNSGLDMLIRELKPERIFISSNFYTISTPRRVGILCKAFPNIQINVVNTEDFPEEIAVWFKIHKANSYINLIEGLNEFEKGIKIVIKGEKYYSPKIEEVFENMDEEPECNLDFNKRHKDLLFMLCNGYRWIDMEKDLDLSSSGVRYHIRELMNMFHVHSREDLIKCAFDSEIVTKPMLKFHKNKREIKNLPDWGKTQIEINRRIYDLKNKKWGV